VRRSRIISAVAAGVLATGGTILGVTLGGTAQAATLSNNWYAAAPYYMPLDNSPPDIGTVMAATGQKAFQLAFILAPNGGGCSPTWDGNGAVSSDTAVAAVIANIRSHGGDVSVSFGGYGGTKLGQTCGTAATAAAYQQVITSTRSRRSTSTWKSRSTRTPPRSTTSRRGRSCSATTPASTPPSPPPAPSSGTGSSARTS
jgi:hypothetical protein